MSPECKIKPGSLDCEECDDWVLVKVKPYQQKTGVWCDYIEKCARLYPELKNKDGEKTEYLFDAKDSAQLADSGRTGE